MSDEKKRGGMTVREAGRLGGRKVVDTLGAAHMAAIGKKGGEVSPTQLKADDPRTREIASRGGKASPGNFAANPERAAAAGRLGGLARAAKRGRRKA